MLIVESERTLKIPLLNKELHIFKMEPVMSLLGHDIYFYSIGISTKQSFHIGRFKYREQNV